MANLNSVLKSRDIILPTKVHIVKVMASPGVMYGCESWTIKKTEHQRIDAFELWCWRRLLKVPWTARRSNQSILKEINPEYSFERLMLRLKLQYFGHLMQRVDSLEKILMLGEIKGKRRGDDRAWDDWMALPTWWTWVWSNSERQWRIGEPSELQSTGSQRVRYDWMTEQQMYYIIVRTQPSSGNFLTHPVHHIILTHPGIYQRALLVPHIPSLASPLVSQVFPAGVCCLHPRTCSYWDALSGPSGNALSRVGTVRRESEPQDASHWTILSVHPHQSPLSQIPQPPKCPSNFHWTGEMWLKEVRAERGSSITTSG